MMSESIRERFRLRNESLRAYLRTARKDPNLRIYNLLPLISSVGQRRFLARLLRNFWPRGRLPRTAQGAALAEALKLDGFALPGPLITPAQAMEMREYFQKCLASDPWRGHLGQFYWDQRPSPEIRMGYYFAHDVSHAPYVLELANHPLLLEAAERYLGCKPTLDNLYCWWSFPWDGAAVGTQKFHRDFDTIAGFKFFIYLSDVDEEGGAHVYVRGSQNDDYSVTAKPLTDEVIASRYDSDAIKYLTGPIGHVFLADTFGIHKGLTPTRSPRLIVAGQYSLNSSPHRPPEPIIDATDPVLNGKRVDPFVNRHYVRRRVSGS